KSDADAVGRGLTVTTRSAGAPAHNPLKGTILNVTVPSTLPVLMGVSLILPEPDALTEEASIGPSIEVVQSNVVPVMLEEGTKVSGASLHICFENSIALFVMTGTGVTSTVTSM